MNLQNLRYFIAVAEHLSFTKAAKYLFVTQPTLSRQITALENTLGIQLIIRTNKSVELTTAGESFLLEVKKIIEYTDNLIKNAEQMKQGHIGVLNIGYSGYIEQDALKKALQSLNKDFPNLDIFLYKDQFGNLKEKLEKEEIDVMFTLEAGLQMFSDIISEKIADNELRAIVPSNHRLANKGKIKFSELANENFILLDRSISPLVLDTFMHLCIEHNFSPNVIRYPTDLQSAFLYVEANFGVSLMSSKIEETQTFDVRFLEFEDINVSYDVVVAWMKENNNLSLPLFINEVITHKNKY